MVLLDETLQPGRAGRSPCARPGKFQLLPEGADHDRPLALAGAADGPAQIALLPTLPRPSFIQAPPSMVGRNDDLQQILQRLHNQRAALIQGVSGVGKTLLAVHCAAGDWR